MGPPICAFFLLRLLSQQFLGVACEVITSTSTFSYISMAFPYSTVGKSQIRYTCVKLSEVECGN